MKFVLLSCLLGVSAVILAQWMKRRYDEHHAADYVQHLQRWQESEPQIKPLDLPEVKALKGERESQRIWRRLRKA